MNRAITVTFDIDTETGEVSNVKTHVEGEVKRRTTTSRKKDVVKETENFPLIKREEGKLIFNDRAMQQMNLTANSRVVIKYEKDTEKDLLFPIIGTDETFGEVGGGNKLTKSNTISFRGNQNTTLAEFGDEFTIEKYKDGVWKLVSDSKTIDTLKEVIELADNVEPQLIIDDEETYEIYELEFKL